MPLVWHNNAGAECHDERAQTGVTEYVGAHVGNLLFLDRNERPKNSAELRSRLAQRAPLHLIVPPPTRGGDGMQQTQRMFGTHLDPVHGFIRDRQ